MPTETVAKYLKDKISSSQLTYEALGKITNTSESTIKNLCSGKTDNPGLKTLLPLMDAVDGSFDEMLHPEKNKGKTKDTSVLALKEMYEMQISTMKETNEAHIKNIRDHYERQISELKEHTKELKEHYEARLRDKREHIETIMLDKKWFRLASVVGVIALVALFLLIEFVTPGHGWFTFGR